MAKGSIGLKASVNQSGAGGDPGAGPPEGATGRGNQDSRANGSGYQHVGYLMAADTETVVDPRFDPGTPDGAPSLDQPGKQMIVALAAVAASIERDENGYERYNVEGCGCFGDVNAKESKILQTFWQTIDRAAPRVVTWGGRRFDAVNWEHRSLLHGVQAFGWFNHGDRFNHYQHRYREDYHADVMDMLSGYGATRFMSQNDVAQLIGMPGKGGVDGADVRRLYEEGRIAEARDYAEEDVLDLYGIYCRYALLEGRMTPEGFDHSIKSMMRYLEQEGQRPDKAHLARYLERWKKAQAPYPFTITDTEPNPLPASPRWYQDGSQPTAGATSTTPASGPAQPSAQASKTAPTASQSEEVRPAANQASESAAPAATETPDRTSTAPDTRSSPASEASGQTAKANGQQPEVAASAPAAKAGDQGQAARRDADAEKPAASAGQQDAGASQTAGATGQNGSGKPAQTTTAAQANNGTRTSSNGSAAVSVSAVEQAADQPQRTRPEDPSRAEATNKTQSATTTPKQTAAASTDPFEPDNQAAPAKTPATTKSSTSRSAGQTEPAHGRATGQTPQTGQSKATGQNGGGTQVKQATAASFGSKTNGQNAGPQNPQAAANATAGKTQSAETEQSTPAKKRPAVDARSMFDL